MSKNISSNNKLTDKMVKQKQKIFWLSRLTFHWVFRLFRYGYKQTITTKDLFTLPKKYQSSYCYDRLMKYWTFKNGVPSAGFDDTKKHLEVPSKGVKHANYSLKLLAWSLVKAFWPFVILTFVLEIIFDVIRLIPAILLGKMIQFVESNDSWHVGAVYTVIWFFSNITVQIFMVHFVGAHMYGGHQIRIALISAAYQKIMRMSSNTQNQYTVGELVNLMAVDSENVFRFVSDWTLTFGCILRVSLAMAVIWQYIGPSALAGFGVVIVFLPILAISTRVSARAQEQQLKKKDQRLRKLNEIFSGIKILKLYAWELFFVEKMLQIRSKEESLLRQFMYCNGTVAVLFLISPMLISGAAFAVYVFSDPQNVLTPEKALVSLSLFQNMRYSLVMIPKMAFYYIQAHISLRRFLDFLLSEERPSDNVGSMLANGVSVSFKNATLSWSTNHSDTVLNNINLKVKKGELIAVVGSVGAGKSSLLNAILGDMYRVTGNVDVAGKIAYVPQQAWIRNESVLQNIVFTSAFNQSWYQEVTQKCCLIPDFESLPYRDLTEIGEKGVNISGGQKQRVSLARAVYQKECDIYLMDDPLSAVDAHVAQQLFADVIGPQGLLKDKTRILVTHVLYVLPDVDRIVVIDNGTITQIGGYAEIMSNTGNNFKTFLNTHLSPESLNECTNGDTVVYSSHECGLFKSDSSQVKSVSESTIPSGVPLANLEKSQVGTVKASVYYTILSYMGPVTPILILVGYCAFRGADVGAGVWLSEWSTDYIRIFGSYTAFDFQEISTNVTTLQYEQTVYRLNGFLIWMLLQVVFLAVGILSISIGVIRATSLLHNRMLISVVRAPMSFFDVTPLGRIINRFSKDVDNLDVELPPVAIDFFDYLVQVLCTGILIGVYLPWFLAVAVPIAAVYYFITVLYSRTSRQVQRLQSVTRSPVCNDFSETVVGVNSIRAFQAQNHFIQQLYEKLDENQNCCLHSFYVSRWMALQLGFMMTVLICSICFFITIYRDNIEPAAAGLILSYAICAIDAFNYLSAVAVNMENTVVSAERIDEYTKIIPEAPWETDVEIKDNWPHAGCIEFQDYSARYREGLDLVLKNISLNINASEKVGIVGRTGAGKSSLTMALFRLIEAAEGSISIDNIDISTLGLHQLRSRLTIIPQDPFLFCGTLRTNIDPTNKYNDTEIWNVLEKSHLANFVRTRKDALNMKITEGDSNISVGQRQLLCFARALLRQTRILVLDEATASIDAETDQLIQQTLRDHFNHCTILTIAHRINTIIDYDRIVVLANGVILEQGTPDELMKNKNSNFFQMIQDAGLSRSDAHTYI